jgi:magnesium transporter
LVQLLDDDENMADLYLTRKLQQTQHMDSPLVTIISDDGGTASSIVSRKLFRLASLKGHGHSRRSTATHTVNSGLDVDELEMLLEAYFMQVDSSLNKLSLVSVNSFFPSHMISAPCSGCFYS